MASFETTMLLFLSSIEGTKNGDVYDVVLGKDGFELISEKSNTRFRDEIKQIVSKKFQTIERFFPLCTGESELYRMISISILKRE